jgi:TonB family protein
VKNTRPEPFVVQTTTQGKTQSQVWNEKTPLAIGHPFRCVIERTDDGVRIRDLKGGLFRLTQEQIERGTKTQISNSTVIFLKQATPVTPPYLPKVTDSKDLSPLFAYAGVRRSLIACNAVHSAYVAYERGKPAFAFYQEADGFRVKTLASGVRLKFKGGAPKVGEVGEVWKLSAEELSVATIFKGWYWWRFNRVQSQSVPFTGPEEDSIENRRFNNISKIIGGTLLAIWFLLQLFVANPPAPEEKTAAPVVQNKVRIFSKAKPKSDSPSTADEPSPAKADTPVPDKAVAKKEKDPTPVVQAKEEAKPQKIVKAVTTVKPHPGPDSAQQKSMAEVKSLKQALSGLKSLHGETHYDASVSKGAQNPDMLFSGSVGTVGTTAVKPLQSGTGIQVHGFGGKNSGYGAAGAGLGNGTGAGGTGKGSFVSLEKSGYRVDEGLTKDEVGEVIHSHMGEVRYCHEAAMLANPKVEGKLLANFSINAGGKITTASVEQSTLGDPQFTECVMSRLKTWQFPHPRGGVTVTVSYPFLFRILERE